jgi:two-component system sensor histidine kinase KdpD
MIYMLTIMFISMLHSTAPSIYAAALSVVAFDFFFVPPYHSFAVADVNYILTFLVMFVVAVLISSLTQRVKRQAQSARGRADRISIMYSMSRELAHAGGREEILGKAARNLKDVFDCEAAFFETGGETVVVSVWPPGQVMQGSFDAAIAQWVWSNGKPAGVSTDTLPGARGLYVPVTVSGEKVGVLAVVPADRDRFNDPEQRNLLETLAMLTGMALERESLSRIMEQEHVRAEREQLRSTLLSSVSHDLRTPVATIMGAAGALADGWENLDPNVRKELIQSIGGESERLNRLVRNLLDMMRLESGAVKASKELQPLEEVVGAALNRMKAQLAGREVTADLPPELPLVEIDAVLMDQLLVNLLENAIKYTPAGSPIVISARGAGGKVVLRVMDRGPGLPEGELEKIFEKFYRTGIIRATGAGLGLSICRAIAQVHDGTITAGNRAGGGAEFTVTLPGYSDE